MSKKDKKANQECGPLKCTQTCTFGCVSLDVRDDGSAWLGSDKPPHIMGLPTGKNYTQDEMEWIVRMYPRMLHTIKTRVGNNE